MAFLDLAPTTAGQAREAIDTWRTLLDHAETSIGSGGGDPAALPAIASALDFANSSRARLPAADGASVTALDKANIGVVSNLSSAALALADVHYDAADALADTASIAAAKIQSAAAAGGLALIKALWPVLLILVLVLAVVIAVKTRRAAA